MLLFDIITFPARVIQLVAIEISTFLEIYVSKRFSEWFYIKFAFPFQADRSWWTALWVSFLCWAVVAFFVIRFLLLR